MVPSPARTGIQMHHYPAPGWTPHPDARAFPFQQPLYPAGAYPAFAPRPPPPPPAHPPPQPPTTRLQWLHIRGCLTRAIVALDQLLGPPPALIVSADPDMVYVEERVAAFLASSGNPDMPDETYPFKQQRQCARFREFTARRRPDLPWFRAAPVDVVAYLISLDKTARTIVHILECPNAGAKNLDKPDGDCPCPRRAKATSLETAVAHLRADFTRNVSPHDWDPQSRSGNPCASAQVGKYISDMSASQTRAGVTISQAVILRGDDFYSLMDHVSTMANTATHTLAQRLQAFSDATAFAFQSASGARMGDLLASLRFRDLRLSPVSMGFRQTWGKTIRRLGSDRDFDLPVHPDPRVCPARRFCELHIALTALGVDTAPGTLLFRRYDVDSDGNIVASPDTYDMINTRYRGHLSVLGLLKGHNLHGLRAKHVVDALLRGIDLESIAGFVGWASKAMPAHYGRMQRTLGALAPFLELVTRRASDKAQYARTMCLPIHLADAVMSRETYELIASEEHFITLS